jgi:leader peptidase (prepilin peptidase)/N-methyltransferase
MWLLATSFVLGLIVGSFLNVVIHRVPRGTFFAAGRRSCCPHCGATIVWFDNVPVLSWLRLRGRARCCGQKISVRYPLIELLTAVAFALVARVHEPRLFDSRGLHAATAGILLLDFYLLASLIAASAIDLEHRILPDVINFLGIGVGFAASLMLPELHAQAPLVQVLDQVGPAGAALLNAATGCAAGAGSLWLIAWIGKAIYKTEAMGLGDVKFMAFTGTIIGPDGVLLALLAGCIGGALFGVIAVLRTGDPHIAFGPFLAAGVLLARFFGPDARRLLLVQWPAWLRESPYALPLTVVVSLAFFVLLVLLRRRRLRPGGSEPS